ncbi:esterase-like activity of phytase family protein [Rodentibacter sp. Ppn85]|uniref:esterase-like activity of phytase family protein n=1 Tax=Rodentibacter sp. Ppn85 TaxID=1908525 RepID=UPI000984AF7E|nr:esterase-like activity of phytase family protein [Rodentibacter sp. Ppn85]OOF66780.1 glycerophosphodiester phosphodiesterase [Rodentibacter sp. Ppn85]
MKCKHCFAMLGLALSMTSAAKIPSAFETPAELAGHAVLPANAVVSVPNDAPSDLKIAGKYTTFKRVEKLQSVAGKSKDRETGYFLPIQDQPRQGHSGIKVVGKDTVWILTDNGFGGKVNSPDSMLYLNQYQINWSKGKFEPLKTVFLADPDKKVPFRIVHEDTKERYLTGSDFDTESFQIIGNNIWIGDEFGPYLIKTDLDGKVLSVFEAEVDGIKIQSPDHYRVVSPGIPNGQHKNVNLKRSKGYEGMASSPDGKYLYPLLEGPLWDEKKQSWETIDDKIALRILEFDVDKQEWTGRYWLYPLENEHNAIGDFNLLDAKKGLIIERDNGEGTEDKGCKNLTDTTHCFSEPAKFKRVYKVEFSSDNVGKAVKKIAYIDLLNISDPNKVSLKPLNGGVLKFPFFTIENLDIVDSEHIIVGNDNNFPFSSSREPNRQDDNELILLKVPALLGAK